MSSLRPLSPEPVSGDEIPIGIPATPSSNRLSLKVVRTLALLQKYSTIPMGFFTVVHLSGVMIAPPIAGIDVAEQVISMGRELYQTGSSETVLFASACVHVLSGIALQFAKKWDNYVKYGRSRRNTSPAISSAKEAEIDKSSGLGGITYLLGLGPRPSLSFKMLGLTPLRFSGYFLLPLLILHVLHQRIAPLAVDADSSMVDLSYIAWAVAQSPFMRATGLITLVGVTSYHILAGALHYLRWYSRRSRKNAYRIIFLNTTLAALSVFSISRIDPPSGSTARKFAAYMSHFGI
ncbi:hypothetical protein KL912_002433 [Ogataea haglerorum]|nr:hypothetical protein KL912_002433 [Ogataea haglerorum]